MIHSKKDLDKKREYRIIISHVKHNQWETRYSVFADTDKDGLEHFADFGTIQEARMFVEKGYKAFIKKQK